jgi:hypothetical protein
MKMSKQCFALLAGVVVYYTAQAQTTIIYNSLTNTPDEIFGPTGIYANEPLADSFSTGAGPIELTDVKVLLKDGSAAGTGKSYVTLYSDKSTSPGTPLASIGMVNDGQLASINTIYDLTLPTPYGLAADTRYWIVLTADSTSRAQWAYSSAYSGTGVAGEYFEIGGIYANTGNGGPFNMEALSIQSVPEPSTVALTGLGGLALLLRKYQRCFSINQRNIRRILP